jgi:hypothetical protein
MCCFWLVLHRFVTFVYIGIYKIYFTNQFISFQFYNFEKHYFIRGLLFLKGDSTVPALC